MDMYRVESEAIRAIGYDPTGRRMRIIFIQGKVHDYCDVPSHVFDALMSADSKGAYFNQEIRDRYEC